MDISRAIRSGLIGWADMTGVIFLGRRSSMTQMDVIKMEGSLFAEPNSATAEVIGFFTHIAMSLWIGLAYALGFRLTGLRPGRKTGLLGGSVHWLIASVAVGVMGRKHPKHEQRAMPGFGGLALGPRSAIGFLVGHLMYGLLFGWQYGRSGEE